MDYTEEQFNTIFNLIPTKELVTGLLKESHELDYLTDEISFVPRYDGTYPEDKTRNTKSVEKDIVNTVYRIQKLVFELSDRFNISYDRIKMKFEKSTT